VAFSEKQEMRHQTGIVLQITKRARETWFNIDHDANAHSKSPQEQASLVVNKKS